LFADPKQGRIDIVQAAGRALRRYSGKDYGYILLPLIVPPQMKFEDFAETTAFRQVASTITALSTQDERIAEEFRAIQRGRISSGKIVEIEGDVPVGMKIKLGEFAEAISTRIWESVGRANWRKFEDARAFVHRLDLKSVAEWLKYKKSEKKPADIPSTPENVYAEQGWSGWGDWLGTGRHIGGWRPINEARAFTRRLGLKSQVEWIDYCMSGKKPKDIPSNPNKTYAKAGWSGFGDWLGTGRVRGPNWQPFKKARAFVRRLGLKSYAQWRDYCRSRKKPAYIPSNPNAVYARHGWAGWGDWFGSGEISTHIRHYLSFKKARAFVRSLGLKSQTEWGDYCRSGKIPDDIPTNPWRTYAGTGWIGFGELARDWQGSRSKLAAVQESPHFRAPSRIKLSH
jgi:hypothetical protein